ncbi:MAG: hypothetical protein JNM31_08460 [Flavobacteriales bacterium]|nr:hypothetical protein [Flavobacteriales bacterium]
MKARILQVGMRSMLIGMVLLLAACAKEEPLAPCGKDNTASPGDTRSMTRDDGFEGSTIPTGTVTRGGGESGGPGISDDGDDEADKERKRKAKR